MRQRPCPRGPGPKSSLPGHFRRYHEVVLHTEHARNSAGLRICHLPIQAVRDNSMEFDLAVLTTMRIGAFGFSAYLRSVECP